MLQLYIVSLKIIWVYFLYKLFYLYLPGGFFMFKNDIIDQKIQALFEAHNDYIDATKDEDMLLYYELRDLQKNMEDFFTFSITRPI